MNLGAIAMFIFGAVILWGGAIYFYGGQLGVKIIEMMKIVNPNHALFFLHHYIFIWIP